MYKKSAATMCMRAHTGTPLLNEKVDMKHLCMLQPKLHPILEEAKLWSQRVTCQDISKERVGYISEQETLKHLHKSKENMSLHSSQHLKNRQSSREP